MNFYGMHTEPRDFLKIELVNPSHVTRVAQLLQGGAVMGRCLQAFESHIPYQLQALADLNLVGMGHVSLSRVLFRTPLPSIQSPPTSQNRKSPSVASSLHVTPLNQDYFTAATIPTALVASRDVRRSVSIVTNIPPRLMNWSLLLTLFCLQDMVILNLRSTARYLQY